MVQTPKKNQIPIPIYIFDQSRQARQLITDYLCNNNYHIVVDGYDYLDIRKDQIRTTFWLAVRLVIYMREFNINIYIKSFSDMMHIWYKSCDDHIVTLDFV